MMTKDFGIGFLVRNPFNKEARKQFQEKWSSMTDNEKLELMNKKVASMEHDRFSVEAINAHCEEWMKMTPEEKQAFVNEWKEAFADRMSQRGCFEGSRFGFDRIHSF